MEKNISTDELNQRIIVLKRVSIFSETSEENLRHIALLLSRVNFDENQLIFKKGDLGNSMYIIINGKVNIHEGSHVFITLESEQFFGEFSLVDANVRSASATAVEPTEMFRLDKDDFEKILETKYDVSKGVMKSIVKRFNDKDFLEAQLTQKNKEIQQQKDEIALQKDEIEKKNKDITDSIKYAQRIQQAILPSPELINKLIPNSFILFKPKSIVSGDFYWLAEKHGKALFAAVDCTGHGVPGALMSMVGNNLLKQAINELNLSNPAQILNALSLGINVTLRQNNEETAVKDGMDLAMCALDRKNMMLEFAAVHNPMYLVRNGEVLEFKADKQPIGEPFTEAFPSFTNNEIPVLPGDTVYVFSDGYIDQFGGPEKKKFMSKRFRETLVRIQPETMEKQKQILNDIFEDWKSEVTQIDDVLVFGVRV